jgi:hypothetical protein
LAGPVAGLFSSSITLLFFNRSKDGFFLNRYLKLAGVLYSPDHGVVDTIDHYRSCTWAKLRKLSSSGIISNPVTPELVILPFQ